MAAFVTQNALSPDSFCTSVLMGHCSEREKVGVFAIVAPNTWQPVRNGGCKFHGSK